MNTSADLHAIEAELKARYKPGLDPWGFDVDVFMKGIRLLLPLYHKYFRVRVFGAENIPQDQKFIAISNHTGQIPIDGILITIAFLLHTKNHLVLRSMAERFLATLPFISSLSAKVGAILGDRENCKYLLARDESILVFPEGVKGISKPTSLFYKLQPFTAGFYRIAVENKVNILPISVIGAEEMYPKVYHSLFLARLLKVPALPLTPLFPLLGILGLIPMPSPIDIYIGKPIAPDSSLSLESHEKEVSQAISQIRNQMQEQIKEGKIHQRPYLSKTEREELMKQFSSTFSKIKNYVTKKS